MDEVIVRRAFADEAEMLASLTRQTFWEAYGGESKLEDRHIKAYMDLAFSVGILRDELGRENTIYLVAETDGEPVGYAKLLVGSRRIEISSDKPIEISRIYLTKEYWGKNIGSLILGKCHGEAKSRKCDSLWLSVWEHNRKAIAFYEKHGFKVIGSHIFDLAGSEQTDLLMEKELKETDVR